MGIIFVGQYHCIQSCKMSNCVHRSNISNQTLPQERRKNRHNFNAQIEEKNQTYCYFWGGVGGKSQKPSNKPISKQNIIKVRGIYPQTPSFSQICVVSQNVYPNLPLFLHRYICHICEILDFCPYFLSFIAPLQRLCVERYHSIFIALLCSQPRENGNLINALPRLVHKIESTDFFG